MKKQEFIQLNEIIFLFLLTASLSFSLLALPIKTFAADDNIAQALFIKNCVGCHVKGGNIIRRNKTLKINALKKFGFNDPESITKIILEGKGSMSSYKDTMDNNEVELLGEWVWLQAQNAWVQEKIS